ncbi:YrvL family regulatory protein [Oceanobacillus bengalensis]|uniref:Regulatory protein YrvL n=1 Tax=Oceanobacillus bengalensis TaxID=1435466 RepID=A0A494Z7W0_9BACI|nr:YrvL family regulatory protein [Oceanobacillus bengalensis]RKQ18675.1 hypothetical protein D8M05_00760 [Oceanobacillus bengalensis]
MKKEENLGLFGKIVVFGLLALLIIFAIAFSFGIMFFGFAGFFDVFGVAYESLQSLVLFLVFFLIFGLVTDLVAKAFFIISASYIADKKELAISRIIVETAFTWLALFVVDEMMLSVSVPAATELLLALLLTIADYIFEGKKKKKK